MKISKLFIFGILFTFAAFSNLEAQTYVVWNPVSDGSSVTGIYPGGTVTVTMTGAGNDMSYNSPALYYDNGTLQVPSGNLTFSTFGATTNPPSKKTTFTFSTPIIISRFNMSEIDTGGGSSWDDSFVFEGITFASATSVNCTATTTGVTAFPSVADFAEYASWFDSTIPVSSFTLNYIGADNLTHAYLCYALEVINASTILSVSVNSSAICTGDSATVTATPGVAGIYSYEWTVPAGVPSPGNVASFNTTVAGVYSVIITDTITGATSTSGSGTVTVGASNVPAFTQVPAICEGDALAALPLTSSNGIIGTWSPAIDNTSTTTYTFTPAAGQCAVNSTMTIVVNPDVTPVFSQIAPICSGTAISPLPTLSSNGVTGTWTPALDNTATTTYTFTPSGSCGNPITMTITVIPNVNPSFVQIQEICAGDNLQPLPIVSNNGVSGTWSPVLNNNSTTTYTFTPDAGQCAFSTNMTIIVNPVLTPEFNSVAPLCFGDSFSLPAFSNNGVTGTWTPAFDNTATTVYTFTPDAGQCALTQTLSIPILDDFDYEILGGCENENFVLNLSAVDNTFDENSATYVWQNSNNLTIGFDSPALDVTAYINSTPVIETVPMTFTVTVTNADGCEKVKPIIIDNMFCGVQQGISANDDSTNDYFDLQLLNVSRLSIFNRYGIKVYSKSNYLKEWTGETDSGDLLPDGTYYYLIEFKNDSAAKTGWIYLNRKG